MDVVFEGIIGSGGGTIVTTADVPAPSPINAYFLVVVAVVQSEAALHPAPVLSTTDFKRSTRYVCYGDPNGFEPTMTALGSISSILFTSATGHIARGFVAAWPCLGALPAGSSLTLAPGVTVDSVQTVVALFSGGPISGVIPGSGSYGGASGAGVNAVVTTGHSTTGGSSVTHTGYWLGAGNEPIDSSLLDLVIGMSAEDGFRTPATAATLDPLIPEWFPTGEAYDPGAITWGLSTLADFTGSLDQSIKSVSGGGYHDIACPWRISFGFEVPGRDSGLIVPYSWAAADSLGLVTWDGSVLGWTHEDLYQTLRIVGPPAAIGWALTADGLAPCPGLPRFSSVIRLNETLSGVGAAPVLQPGPRFQSRVPIFMP